MKDKLVLENLLKRIDGKGYKNYREIAGEYEFDQYRLYIDHVQGDPFASPSRIRVIVSQEKGGFPLSLLSSDSRRRATEDYLTRHISKLIQAETGNSKSIGGSAGIRIMSCGQEILRRTAVLVNSHKIELRLNVGLPAQGRRILGQKAIHVFFDELPGLIEAGLVYNNLDSSALFKHVYLAEDQAVLREKVQSENLIAFVANDSLLPRKSGVEDLPLKEGVVPFRSPREMEVSFDLPHVGRISGMGIKKGVTLIVGGGYHGKSTLLRALQTGVYDHIPGDGREFVVTLPDAVKIRAKDGRKDILILS